MTPRPDFNDFPYYNSSSSDYEYNKKMRKVIQQMLDEIREKNARGSISEGEVEEKEFLSEEDMEI